MPPRIRSLKPDLWRDQTLQGLPLGARLTFIGVFSHADDEGRLEGDPVILRSMIHPRDTTVSQRAFNGWLDALDQSGLIRRYMVDGKRFIDVPKFRRHQVINRPTPSSLPPWEDAALSFDSVNGFHPEDVSTQGALTHTSRSAQ